MNKHGYDAEALAPWLTSLLMDCSGDASALQDTIEEMLDNPGLVIEILNKWRDDRVAFLAEEQSPEPSQILETSQSAPESEPESEPEPTSESAPDLDQELVYDYEEEDADAAAAQDAEIQLYVLTSLCETTNKWSIDAVHSAITAACSQEDSMMVDAALLEENTRVLLEAAEQACINCKPCRHLLQGSGCFRSDCYFDHDFDSLPCRFWLFHPGACVLQQEEGGCKFAHGFAAFFPHLALLQARSVGSTSGIDVDSFPSLPGAGSAAGASSSFAVTGYRAALLESQGSSPPPPPNQPRTPLVSSLSRPRSSNASNGRRSAALFLDHSDWVDSGKSLASMYASLRAEARDLALARNKMLQEATRAFLRGERAAARSLSESGQALNQQMHSKHAAAAEAIFRERNPRNRLEQGHVDLHGLHAAEAEALLYDGLLERIKAELGVRRVAIITGTGNHSVGPRGRLLPVVESFVKDRGYSFAPIKDPHSSHIGGLSVALY